jgi:hypothetical protein
MNGETVGVYSESGNRTVIVLEDLAKICADDADYKEEISKLNSIVVGSKPKYDEYKSVFNLSDDGLVLSIETGNHLTRNKGHYTKTLMNLY